MNENSNASETFFLFFFRKMLMSLEFLLPKNAIYVSHRPLNSN